MSYPNGTILKRLDPVVDDVNGVNRIKIVGPSPVRGADTLPEWQSKDGDYYIIQPVDTFAANQIAPESALRVDYEVDEYPDLETTVDPVAMKKAAQERLRSPEDVFATEAQKVLVAKKAATKAAPKA